MDRRNFLMGSVIATSALAALTLKAEKFIETLYFKSVYSFDVSVIPGHKQMDSEQVLKAIAVRMSELPYVPQDWHQRYSINRSNYIDRGQLISTSVDYDKENSKVMFSYIWKDKQSFYSFFHDSQFNFLDKAYCDLKLNPGLVDGEYLFPNYLA